MPREMFVYRSTLQVSGLGVEYGVGVLGQHCTSEQTHVRRWRPVSELWLDPGSHLCATMQWDWWGIAGKWYVTLAMILARPPESILLCLKLDPALGC